MGHTDTEKKQMQKPEQMPAQQQPDVSENVPVIIRKEGRSHTRCLNAHRKGELVWLTAPSLENIPWIRHGFSTRLGGVSTGDVGSMNLGFAREENQENVRENYRRLCGVLDVVPEQLVLTKQTHTTNIRIAEKSDAGSGFTREREYDDVDGLVTDVKGMTLVCFSADCVPLLAVDPEHRAIGVAHSGWRGTVGDIGGELLRTMRTRYGTDPANVLAVIGPSICQECYEVSEDVIERFREVYDPGLYEKLFYGKGGGKYQLDLWEACRQNFLRAGVPENNITVTDICTHCNPSLLYSHRTLHGRQGNLGAFLGIA